MFGVKDLQKKFRACQSPGVHFATGPCPTPFFPVLGLVRLPTRRARCASRQTSRVAGRRDTPPGRPLRLFPVPSGLVSPPPAVSLLRPAGLPPSPGGRGGAPPPP